MKDALGNDIEVGDLIVELYKGMSLFYRVTGFSKQKLRALLISHHGTYYPRTKVHHVYSKNVVKVDLEQFIKAYTYQGGRESNIEIFIEHSGNALQ